MKLAHQTSLGSVKEPFVESINQQKRASLVPSVPIEEFGEHLRTLVARLQKETQAKVYLVTSHPVSRDYQKSEWSPELREQQRLVYARYRSEVLDVGRTTQLKIADVYSRFEKSVECLLGPDGIHPNAHGMAVYAEELHRKIQADLGARSR